MSHARRDKQNGASGRQRQVANDESSPQQRRRPDIEERHLCHQLGRVSALVPHAGSRDRLLPLGPLVVASGRARRPPAFL